jgi:hypothetical protein
MIDRLRVTLLILGLTLISGCSQIPDPPNKTSLAKECAKIVPLFNEMLLSNEKSEKINGWQYVIEYPACFTSNALDIAKIEIEALKN